MEKYALVFPGQGSQYIGMGKTLYEENHAARRTYEEANDILGFDIKKLSFEGSSIELNQIEKALPAILIASVAAFRVFRQEIDENPQVAAGHSLGEYTALTCSGAISFADALRIVKLRSTLACEIMDTKKGAMTVINNIVASEIEDACKKISHSGNSVSIACYNAPDQFVICGHQDAVMKVEDILIEKDAQITPMLMSPPFHCCLMESVAEKLSEVLNKTKFDAFKWPVFSNVTAALYRSVEDIAINLSSQVIKPVRWLDILNNIKQQGIENFIEIGPQSVLSDLTRKSLSGVKVFSYTQINDRNGLLELFKPERNIRKKRKGSYTPSVVTKCLAAAVSVRNANWNNDEYEKGVVIPFREVQKIQIELQKEDLLPTTEQMYKAVEMLKSVLNTKKVPMEKQRGIFERILEETGTREILKVM